MVLSSFARVDKRFLFFQKNNFQLAPPAGPPHPQYVNPEYKQMDYTCQLCDEQEDQEWAL